MCYLLFLLAFYPRVKYMSTKWGVFPIVALLLFSGLFGTNSLLVFYVVGVFPYIADCETLSVLFAQRHVLDVVCSADSDFLPIPVGFFVMKLLFFVPHGISVPTTTRSVSRTSRDHHTSSCWASSRLSRMS